LNTAAFALLALAAGQPVVASAPAGASAAERRVVDYLRTHVQPGQPVVVSELYNGVFSAPEERAALQRLFNLFFKLPLPGARRLSPRSPSSCGSTCPARRTCCCA